ncbi:hypothetical protein QAD02_011017 [Eretmocerus hayati]|uniref:Uncharacterized protein n=1 Tax=Eretmocerus hayati TaxID=131215 RepID=A0ACC2NVQ5_9HYME|nr:hypothetical protein QAD02_011017 [Eretmocerus hayati]
MLSEVIPIFFGILSIHLSLMFSQIHVVLASEKNLDNRMKVIIDTDAGGDDAVALMLALTVKEIEVLAITCTYGNTHIDNVEINVLKTLTIANRSDVPVYSGARKPLMSEYIKSIYFGEDGFGDFHFDKNLISSVNTSSHAANAMIDLVQKYPGEVHILTLGPLTNVALAASLNSNFTKLVKRFYIMGLTMANENGEEVPENEYNFGLDPGSVAIFLNYTTQYPSLIIPSDAVARTNISRDWRIEKLGKLNSESIEFLNKVENVTLTQYSYWHPADSIAFAAMIWPDQVLSTIKGHMVAIIQGPLNATFSLDNQTHKDQYNVEIMRNFNVSAYQDKLISHLS